MYSQKPIWPRLTQQEESILMEWDLVAFIVNWRTISQKCPLCLWLSVMTNAVDHLSMTNCQKWLMMMWKNQQQCFCCRNVVVYVALCWKWWRTVTSFGADRTVHTPSSGSQLQSRAGVSPKLMGSELLVRLWCVVMSLDRREHCYE